MVDRSADGRLTPTLMSFDVFGTLIDVRGSSYAAFESILRESGADACRCKGVLGALGGTQHRALLGALPPLSRHLRAVPCRDLRPLRHQGAVALIQRYFDAFPSFQVFPDVAPTLDRLAKRYRLAVVSNIDDDLFAETPARAHLRPRLHSRARGRLQARRHALQVPDRQRRLQPRGDPALRTVAVHRHGRRQAARADHRLDQPARRVDCTHRYPSPISSCEMSPR